MCEIFGKFSQERFRASYVRVEEPVRIVGPVQLWPNGEILTIIPALMAKSILMVLI